MRRMPPCNHIQSKNMGARLHGIGEQQMHLHDDVRQADDGDGIDG